PAPDILMLLDESVLYREFGGSKVMAEQLSDLSRLSREKRVVPRVVPFSVEAPLPLLGTFEILDLGDSDAVMYRENNIVDEMVDDPVKIQFHREIFEQLRSAAEEGAGSVHLIEGGERSANSSARRKSPG